MENSAPHSFAHHEESLPRILVVDDDPGIIQVLARVLDPVGEVFFGLNGREAMAMAWQVRPEIILLDAEMPEMDGFSVCSALKGAPDLADIPVIFLTAHREVEREIRALELGAVDFIHKPISPPIVQARVRTHLALKKKSDDLLRQTRLDGLTGIGNRRSLDQALEMEWRRGARSKAPLSLVLGDVDFFKRYNDCYGHIAGDECLKSVAAAFQAMAKRSGDVAARYGGEEFGLLLPHTGHEQALLLARQLCRQVEGLAIPHADSDVGPVVTVSLGVASLSLNCDEVEGAALDCRSCGHSGRCGENMPQTLIEAADRALYKAKGEGRNRACAMAEVLRGFPAPEG